MEMHQFDALTRQVSCAGSSRRQAMRTLAGALLGGALGGAAARLGLSEDAEAKAKKKRKRRTPGAKGPPTGALQTEGKRKKRKNRNKSGKNPQNPPPPCGPGQKRCPGYTECFAADDCCPNAVPPLCSSCQKVVCENGGLVCRDRPGQKDCGSGVCVQETECCPLDLPLCGDCQEVVCEGGERVCRGECCEDEKRCDNGDCVAQGACCPEDALPPWTCHGQCGDQICEDGEPVCRPRRAGEPCQGSGTACCKGRCHNSACLPARNGRTRHWNQEKCNCDCDVVDSCPPGKSWDHGSCSCECNCMGSCCLSGCCASPDGSAAFCCDGY